MQDAFPLVAETPMVSLIPEVRVYTGQNQIRRNVGMFVKNVEGSETQTINQLLNPGDDFEVPGTVTAFVLSSTETLAFRFTTYPGSGEPTTTEVDTAFLVWDIAADDLRFTNNSENMAEVSLIFIR